MTTVSVALSSITFRRELPPPTPGLQGDVRDNDRRPQNRKQLSEGLADQKGPSRAINRPSLGFVQGSSSMVYDIDNTELQ